MSWEVTRSDKNSFRAESGRDYLTIYLNTVSQTFQGEWCISGVKFNVGNCATLEAAQNQLDQQIATKNLAELSQVAAALKDFKIEGS